MVNLTNTVYKVRCINRFSSSSFSTFNETRLGEVTRTTINFVMTELENSDIASVLNTAFDSVRV